MTVETATRLVQMRKLRGLSQEALAEKLGVSRQAVSKWERAEASPDTDNLIMLARLYGVSIDELLGHKPTDSTANNTLDFPDYYSSRNESAGDTFNQDNQAAYAKVVAVDDSGIHVDAKDTEVHVAEHISHSFQKANTEKPELNHDNVSDNASDNVSDTDDVSDIGNKAFKTKASFYALHSLPVPIIITILFLILGCVWDLWHSAWMLYLLIPIYGSIVSAVEHRNIRHFNYPVFISLIYLCLGFFCSWWHPGWIVFLTIPIFYAVCPGSYKAQASFRIIRDDEEDFAEEDFAEEDSAEEGFGEKGFAEDK